MNLSEYTKKIRSKTGLTQEQFAKAVGITRERLAKYETEATSLPAELLLEIQKIEKSQKNSQDK